MLGDVRIVEDMAGIDADDVKAAPKDGRGVIFGVDNDIFLDICEVTVDLLGMDTLAVCDSKAISIVTFIFVWNNLKGISAVKEEFVLNIKVVTNPFPDELCFIVFLVFSVILIVEDNIFVDIVDNVGSEILGNFSSTVCPCKTVFLFVVSMTD